MQRLYRLEGARVYAQLIHPRGKGCETILRISYLITATDENSLHISSRLLLLLLFLIRRFPSSSLIWFPGVQWTEITAAVVSVCTYLYIHIRIGATVLYYVAAVFAANPAMSLTETFDTHRTHNRYPPFMCTHILLRLWRSCSSAVCKNALNIYEHGCIRWRKILRAGRVDE